jgi:hypothetical protein
LDTTPLVSDGSHGSNTCGISGGDTVSGSTPLVDSNARGVGRYNFIPKLCSGQI